MSSENKKTQTTEQKAKRKKILWGIFWGTAVSAVVAAGIGIPLVQAKKSLPKPTPLLNNDSVIMTLTGPNGKEVKVTWGNINQVHELVNANKNIATGVEQHLTKYLYEQEYKGSLWYEAVYNADKAKSDEKSFALPTIEKVRQDVTKELDDVEKKYQEQYGVEKKWEEKFLEYLASPLYGNAKSKTEAIEYKVTEKLNKDAYRRYQTQVNTDFTYSELKNGIVANKDVFYTYKGEKIEIAKKGETIRLSFAKENQNYVLPAEDTIELKTDSKDEVKVPIFTTKSYVEAYINADRFIAPWIARKQSVVSGMTLSAHPNMTDSSAAWTVTKAEMIKLLTFSTYLVDDNQVQVALGIDKLADFTGVSPLLESANITSAEEIAAKNTEKIIQYVASNNKDAAKYGSEGYKNIVDQINTNDPAKYIPLMSVLLGDATADSGIYKYSEKSTLFSDLKNSLVAIFGEDKFSYDSKTQKTFKEVLSQAAVTKNKTDNYVEEYAKYNEAVSKYINQMNDKDFQNKFGMAFRDAFGDANNSYKIGSLIKVGSNFLTVSDAGIAIKNIYVLSTPEIVQRLIAHDLAIQSKANYTSTLTTQLFNLDTIFNGILTKDFMVNDLLSQDEFKTYIKQQEYTNLDNKTVKFTDDDIAKALKYEKLLDETQKYQLIQNKANEIKTFIKAKFDNGVYADFKYNQASNQFYLDPHDTQDVLPYLFNTIVNFIKGI
ncbi:HinT-interacting membrane complex protein P80 [Metamycoplasma neophronis]|uniref:Membrane protein P80 n=1 Tax=Metamycoplasma neophronis TaxID=872983 RepID=A0ABY2Z0J9_9BACT|nr:hypothetical protein [Metamycoplasma neophronis]TPR54675.1 hypothetical protein FJR74_00165 [Metamycoplasma neophronis]